MRKTGLVLCLTLLSSLLILSASVSRVKAEEENVINGSFEVGNGFYGWTSLYSEISMTESHTGSNSCLQYYSQNVHQDFAISFEDITSITCWLKKDAYGGGGVAQLSIYYTTGAGGSGFLAPAGASAYDWTEIDILAEIVDEGYDVGDLEEIGFQKLSDNSCNYYIDDLSVMTEEGSSVIVEGEDAGNFYFRNTAKTYGETTAYYLAPDYGPSSSAASGSIAGSDLYFGFTVDLIDKEGTSRAITGETPVGEIWLDSDYEDYSLSAFELENDIRLTVGWEAMRVRIYSSEDEEAWTLEGTFISDPLMYSAIESGNWTFILWTEYVDTGSADWEFKFGNWEYQSRVNNIQFEEANEFEIIQGYLMGGNLVEGLLIFPFTYVLGEVFWLLIMIGALLPMYIRHRNIGTVLLFFILFGGVGGLFTWLIPAPFIYAVWIMLLVGMAGLFWRATR